MWEKRLKSVLVNVNLYAMMLYPLEKLESELNAFLKDVESVICSLLRRYNVLCYRDIREQYPVEDAIKVFNEILNKLRREKKYDLAFLLHLSHMIYKPESLTPREKIYALFYILSYAKELLGVDVSKVHEEVISEVKKIIEGVKK
jgi:hypothetical protein